MNDTLKITLWELDTNRIADIHRNLRQAAMNVGLKIDVSIMSEPPLISRMNLTHRVPILEIDGQYWSLPSGQPITEAACERLFAIVAGAGRGE